MRRRAPPLHHWIGSIILSLIASGLARAEEVCKAADALLKAGYIDDAKTTYVELLTGDDKPGCAGDGLLEARKAELAKSTELCAAAEALWNAGYFEEATTAYVELLSSDGVLKPDCAREGLVGAKAEDSAKRTAAVSHALALSDFGLHDKALETIQTQLESDDKTEVPRDLQYLFGGKVPIWRSMRRDLEPWARPILEIAAAVMLLIVLVSLLARRFGKRTLAIEEFDSRGLEGEHLGKDFASIIRSQLNRIAAGSQRGRISLVTGPIQAIDIPAEIEAAVPEVSASWMSPLTWVKAIPALLNWLSPPRTVSLTGQLHKPGNRGVGITVQLVEKSRILASYTIWQKDFDDASDPAEDEVADSLHQLAEYAAVWLVFEMAKNFGSGLELLGTDDWRSYACFRAGFLAENQGRDEAAKRLYIRALRLDPKLRGARVNLAVWFHRHQKPEVALEQLSRAKEECVKAIDGDRDPTLYSAIYNLATLEYDKNNVLEARNQTFDLLNRIDSTLVSIENKKKGYKDPALKYHLVTIRTVANVMLGGLMVELGEDGGLERIEEETNISSVFPRLQYNLACGYSVLAQHEPLDQPASVKRHEQYLQNSLSHLERAFQIHAEVVNQVKDDRSLEYVRLAQATEYQALLDDYGSPPAGAVEPTPALPLAEVGNIGEEHAEKLLGENIQTQGQLLQETLDPVARQALATKLNVTKQLVTQWAHAMDLLRIVGLGPPQLKLLALAEIHCLTKLEASNPSSLKALLDDLSNAEGEIDPPNITMVNAWVNDARTNTKPKVI